MVTTEAQRAVEAVWRIESARVVAGLARMVGDVGWAEDLAQEALLAALEQWPRDGTPRNPGAWLTTVAKRRAVDGMRRRERLDRKLIDLGRERSGGAVVPDFDAAVDGRIPDDVLRLIFTACHPVLSAQARTALTLRMVGGLSTAEIARAFLVSESTVAQRIVRAKRRLADAAVPFEVPEPEERPARLASVLEVIYLIFNEGYAATAGDDWMRPALCEDAQRLARMTSQLMPEEGEVHGLAALLQIQASRTAARVGPDGEPMLLLDQDRSRWDRLLIGRGLAALERAQALDGVGPYTLQAAIAACHARARTGADTDWERIGALYADLAALTGSPVVELNRAVAVAMAHGPRAGLALVDPLRSEPALLGYHLLPSVRGDLLGTLGRLDEAHGEFTRAARLAGNERERALLLERAASCRDAHPPSRRPPRRNLERDVDLGSGRSTPW